MSRRINPSESEARYRWRELAATVALGAAAIGLLAGQSEQEAPSTGTYTCSDIQEFEIKDGEGLDALLERSGATKQAGAESQKLLRALGHEAIPGEGFTGPVEVDITGNFEPVSFPVTAGQMIDLPTSCERNP